MFRIAYTDYRNVYGGTLLTEEEWIEYSRQAAEFINELSAGRLFTVTLNEKDTERVICALGSLAEYDKKNADRVEKERIASESVDSHSRSYNTGATSKSNEEVYEERTRKVMGYLLPTNLLYRGI